MKELKTSAEWFELHKNSDAPIIATEILDPDGWDRINFEKSWNELITKEEFEQRLSFSTCIFKRN